MKNANRQALSTVFLAVLATVSTGLVGCGGDGGDPGGAVTLDLTAANSDTVAHATAAGFLAFGSTAMVPLGTQGGTAAQGTSARALGATGSAAFGAWLPPRVLGGLLQAMQGGPGAARSGMARPLATVALEPMPCSVAGTSTLRFEDGDGDGLLDVGEVFTFDFNNCQDTTSEVINGSMSGAITRINSDGTAFGARVTLAPLTQEALDGSHSLGLDGKMLLDYRVLNDTAEEMNLTADGPVAATVRTHLPFKDAVTLRSGFAQGTTHDSGLGRSSSTVTGVMESALAGGSFAVSTMTPIELYDADAYPRVGTVEMRGRTGIMNLQALSTAQVQIALDANGDGSFESSTPQTWDWLF
jgi:hypothetical protein